MRHGRGKAWGLLVGLLLGGWLIATPAAQSYLWGAINGIPFGPGLLTAAGGYHSWGSTYGEDGYGVRFTDAGQGQFKDSGGAWTAFNAGASTNFWQRTGTTLSPATAGDNLVINGVGPHAIGGAALAYSRFALRGSFTSSGVSSIAVGLRSTDAITAAAGDITYLAGASWENNFVTPGSAEVFALAAQAIFFKPTLTVGAGDTVTESATVYISNAATEATTNWALKVAAGNNYLSGLTTIATGLIPDANDGSIVLPLLASAWNLKQMERR